MKLTKEKIIFNSIPYIILEVAVITFFLCCKGEQGVSWLVEFILCITISCVVFNIGDELCLRRKAQKQGM